MRPSATKTRRAPDCRTRRQTARTVSEGSEGATEVPQATQAPARGDDSIRVPNICDGRSACYGRRSEDEVTRRMSAILGEYSPAGQGCTRHFSVPPLEYKNSTSYKKYRPNFGLNIQESYGKRPISLHRQKNLSLSPYGSLDLRLVTSFYGEIREKKTRFEIPRILAKYRRLAMHVKEMQPSVSVLDATDRERTQRIVASFIINLFKSLSESAQDFDSQQPFTRSPPFAPPLIRGGAIAKKSTLIASTGTCAGKSGLW